MTKFILNDDDIIRVSNDLYKFSSGTPRLNKYSKINGLDVPYIEIYKHGNDKDSIKVNIGDILEPQNKEFLSYIFVADDLMELNEFEEAERNKKASSSKVVKLVRTEPTLKEEHEFDKRDKEMTRSIEDIKNAIEVAEGEGWTTIDGVRYGTPHVWREVAEIALDLANQQEWFDRYSDKYLS